MTTPDLNIPPSPGKTPPINAAAAPSAVEELRPIRAVLSPNVQPLGHRILHLEAIVPEGTPREHLLAADFWMHTMMKLQDYTILHCLWEDGTQYARVMCTHKNGRASRFVSLEHRTLETLAPTFGSAGNPDFKVEQRGPKKWCVIDLHDGTIMKEMIATQAQANQEMKDLITARAR